MDDARWLAQENALRDGQDSADRLLLQALAEPVLDPVPQNFAAQMATLALRPADDRPELLLQSGLLALLVAAGLAIILPDTLPAGTDAAMPGWLTLVLLCLALSAAPSFLGRRSY